MPTKQVLDTSGPMAKHNSMAAGNRIAYFSFAENC